MFNLFNQNLRMYDRKLLAIFLFAYSLVLVYAMFWGLGRVTHNTYLYNLTPFSSLKIYIATDSFSLGQRLINVIGNIVAFIPFGILIPLVFKASFPITAFIFLVGILVLETFQLFTRRGVFDVDDFIVNTLGLLIGYLFFKAMRIKPL